MKRKKDFANFSEQQQSEDDYRELYSNKEKLPKNIKLNNEEISQKEIEINYAKKSMTRLERIIDKKAFALKFASMRSANEAAI